MGRVITFYGIVIFAVLFGGGALALWYFGEAQRTKRALRAAKSVRIADAPEGSLVKISGQVKLGDRTLTSPIGQRPCAVFQVTVEELRSSGKSSSWVTLVDDRDFVEFHLEDGTGVARVVPMPPLDLAIEKDVHVRTGSFDEPEPHLVDYLHARGYATEGWFGINKKLRWREGVIEAGEEIAVLGACRRELDPDPRATQGYREKAKRLVVESPAGGKMLISDDPTTTL